MATKSQHDFGRDGSRREGEGDEKQIGKQSLHAWLSHLLSICASNVTFMEKFIVLDCP